MSWSTSICAAITLVWACACTGEFELDQPSDLDPPAQSADAGSTVNGAAYFAASVLPLLSTPRPKGACAICHQGSNAGDGPDFLGLNAETNYATLLASPGLIGTTAANSSLYTRGDHGGNAFLPEELAAIAMWIAMEQ